MKKFNIILAIGLSLCMLCVGCAIRKTAKGKNAKIDYTGTASVSFYPVCPECNHISTRCSVNTRQVHTPAKNAMKFMKLQLIGDRR